MPTRLSKKKVVEAECLNSIAGRIAAQTTDQESPKEAGSSDVASDLAKIRASLNLPVKEKNPAAVALGKLGASKGGKARAASLSEKRRQEIAKNAAATRWSRDG